MGTVSRAPLIRRCCECLQTNHRMPRIQRPALAQYPGICLIIGLALQSQVHALGSQTATNPATSPTAECSNSDQRYLQLASSGLQEATELLASRFGLQLVSSADVVALPVENNPTPACRTLPQWLSLLLPDHIGYRVIEDTLVLSAHLAPAAQTTTTTTIKATPTANTDFPDEILVTAALQAGATRRSAPELTGNHDFKFDREQLRQTGVRNLPAALELASGVKIENNRYAIIRGMTGRYQTIQINRGELPSLDPAGQNFPLDFIPLGILNSVDLQKSVYADAPGQASAGILNLDTMQLPEHDYAQLATSYLYRQGSNHSSTLQGYVSSSDWYGFDDGSRRIPGLLLHTARHGSLDDLSNTQRQQLGEAAAGDMGLYQANSQGSGGLDISTGLSRQISNATLGGTLSFNLRDHWQNTWIQSTSYSTGTGYSGSSADFHHEDSTHQRSEHIIDLSVMTALGLDINDEHYFGFNVLWLHQSTHRAELIETQGKSENNFPSNTAYRRALINWTERSLLQRQLYGRHRLTSATDLYWQVASTQTDYDRPHDLDYRYSAISENSDYSLQLSPSTTNIGWRSMQQQSRSVSLHLNRIYSLRTDNHLLTGELKWGWESSQKQRHGYNLLYTYSGSDDLTSNSQLMEQPNPNDILTPELITGDASSSGFILQDTLFNTDSGTSLSGRFYRATQINRATYLLNDLDLSEHWQLISGIRREYNQMKAALWNTEAHAEEPLQTASRWLPSVALEYRPGFHQLRANYSQTVVWPRFNELLPVIYEDLDTRTKTIGNPNLNNSDVHNWDLSWQWKPLDNPLRLGSSLYLKRIHQPIEGTFSDNSEATDQASYSNYSYQNSPFGQIQGLELEADYQWQWSGQNIEIQGRYASIRSRVQQRAINQQNIDETESDSGVITETTTSGSRPLQGQPAYISALRLQYQPSDTHTFSLVYKRSGTQLYITSDRDDLPAVYQQPRNHLDINWTWQTQPWRLTLSVNNLLDTAYRYTQGDYAYLTYRTGREFWLSLDIGF